MRWVAELDLAGSSKVFVVTNGCDAGRCRTTVSFPPLGGNAVPVDLFEISGSTAKLRVRLGGEMLDAEMHKSADGSLQGAASVGNATGALHLFPVAQPDAALFGAYESGDGNSFIVAPFEELGGEPFLLHVQSGRFAPLYARTSHSYWSGVASRYEARMSRSRTAR